MSLISADVHVIYYSLRWMTDIIDVTQTPLASCKNQLGPNIFSSHGYVERADTKLPATDVEEIFQKLFCLHLILLGLSNQKPPC